MSPRRRITASVATIGWIFVVGIAVLLTGTRVAPCFQGVGPAAKAAHDRCAAEYFAANSPPPPLDSPLFWLAVMAIGVGLIWMMARRPD